MSTAPSTFRMASAGVDRAAASLLARTRREWRAGVMIRALVSGLALALATGAVLVLLDQLLALPAGARATLRILPPLALLAFSATAAFRVLRRPEARRLALLAEEHRPELAYRLSTWLDLPESGGVASLFALRARDAVAGVQGRVVPLSAGLALRRLAAAMAAAAFVLLLVPGGSAEVMTRWWRLAAGPSSGVAAPGLPGIGRTAGAAQLSFRDVRVEVEPPAYARNATFEGAAGDPLVALVGSLVVVRGSAPASATRVEARVIGGEAAPVEVEGDRFVIAWALASTHRGAEITAYQGDQLIAREVVVLTPRADAPPQVELTLPERDLVLAEPRGAVPVRATVRDDYGVADFRLEWILTRGSGESFALTEGRQPLSSTRAGSRETGAERSGSATLDIAALGLQPGDVLHVRAHATDRNSVSGPGEGTSTTRVIRIARAGEEDQANTLIGFPLEMEADPVLSQRMIVLLTERLIERAPTLSRDALQTESDQIARHQGRLRVRLAEVIYGPSIGADEPEPPVGGALPIPGVVQPPTEPDPGHAHDADPPIAVNLALIPAFNAMYEAERYLRQAEPRQALPHELMALRALQGAREAERIFVRGAQTVAPIDVDAVRGTGRMRDVGPAARTAGRATPSALPQVQRLASLAARVRTRADAELRPGGSPADAELALDLSAAAAELLEDPTLDPRAGGLVARAASALAERRADAAAELLAQARMLLEPPAGAAGSAPLASPASAAAAAFLARLGEAGGVGEGVRANAPRAGTPSRPFVFATARYQSGDWDSAPLVPANLIHSLALYTEVAVLPEGVVVDLDSPALFRYPFVFLTGHIPVRFSAAEAANLRAYVERGGFIFIDDHNHDIDGAFHRTVTAELARVFGEDALVPLPDEHELYRAFFVFEDGPPTTSHELNGWGDGLIHEKLFAIERGGRIGVLYSNKDYASEWSYHAVNKRFLALDNTRFGVNVLVYALTR